MRNALKLCQLKSQNPSNCELYATVRPKSPTTKQGMTLGQSVNIRFNRYRTKHRNGKFGAFAATANGSSGYSWDYDSEVGATTAAISACKENVENMAEQTSALILDSIIDKNGHTCNVIHITRPE